VFSILLKEDFLLTGEKGEENLYLLLSPLNTKLSLPLGQKMSYHPWECKQPAGLKTWKQRGPERNKSVSTWLRCP
jgi:hypothetical protein